MGIDGSGGSNKGLVKAKPSSSKPLPWHPEYQGAHVLGGGVRGRQAPEPSRDFIRLGERAHSRSGVSTSVRRGMRIKIHGTGPRLEFSVEQTNGQ